MGCPELRDASRSAGSTRSEWKHRVCPGSLEEQNQQGRMNIYYKQEFIMLCELQTNSDCLHAGGAENPVAQ